MILFSANKFIHRFTYDYNAHIPGEGNGNPLQYSCLENPMDRGAWQATGNGVTEWTWLTEQLNTHTQGIFLDIQRLSINKWFVKMITKEHCGYKMYLT